MFLRFSVRASALTASLVLSVPSPARAQGTIVRDASQVVVVAARYLRSQMAQDQNAGLVQYDARSLRKLLPDSAESLRARMADALGVPLADAQRLDLCKGKTSPCVLGSAREMLDVRSILVNGARATVDFHRYTKKDDPSASVPSVAAVVLRVSLVLTSAGWTVTKLGIVSS